MVKLKGLAHGPARLLGRCAGSTRRCFGQATAAGRGAERGFTAGVAEAPASVFVISVLDGDGGEEIATSPGDGFRHLTWCDCSGLLNDRTGRRQA